MGTIDNPVSRAVAATGATGLVAGTTILTLDGEMPVEHLSEGDRIITRDSGMAILRRIERVQERLQPIRIKAGSLGHTRPDRDMVVAPSALLHIRDWRAEALYGSPTATIAAHDLVDGEFLVLEDPRDITTFQLVFDKQHILYADGVEILSAAV